MRGGVIWFQKEKIVKLLTNLIINNFMEDSIRILCQPQSLPTTEQPLLPTTEQPLLPTTEQPLLLKNAKEVNQRLMNIYSSVINPTQNTSKFEYKFYNNDLITKSIIKALKTKDISYFDRVVEEERTVAILSPDKFNVALTSQFRGVFTSDVLVYSMFALAQKVITLIPIINSSGTAKIDLNDKVCPPISDV
jgi:hypothetical protein